MVGGRRVGVAGEGLQGPEMRAKLGIKDNLIRFSTGVEDVEDLWVDLDRALQRSC